MAEQTTHITPVSVVLVRPAADSLAVCREPLPFHPLFPEMPCRANDSLPARDTLQVLPTAIFGPQTTIATITTVQQTSVKAASEPYQWQPASATLTLICMFCFTFYRYHIPLRMVFKSILSLEGALAIFENPSRDMSHFINFARLMFALVVSIPLALKVSEMLPEIITASLYYPALLAVAGMLIVIKLISTLVSRAAGSISDSQYMFAEARAITNFNIVIAAYILAPIITVATLANSLTTWVLIPAVALLLYHVIRLFRYLYLQKFSFLQWFLYLCGVEIIPLLLIPAIAIAVLG